MHDLIQQVIFYVFAGLAVLSALMVITQNNPVRCVLFLVLAFFASSVLWLLVQAEFLALILVLVYVGAVMTLFLFVVMMLNIDIESRKIHLLRRLPLGLMLVAVLVALLLKTLVPHALFEPTKSNMVVTTSEVDRTVQPVLSDTEALGMVLYTDNVLAFELAAFILLVAIIASITLVHRTPRRSKHQNIVTQIMTRREERVTLVTLKSEKLGD